MSSVVISGNTSGAITVAAPAVAGTNTLTLPAATDTLVGKATTDTLTNKTLTAPVISTISNSGTLTLPTGTNTLNVVGPTFGAYLNSAQTLSNVTWTKAQVNIEEFDTANCFDNATNFRFTPNVAGYYLISGGILIGGSTSASNCLCSIYKNGSAFKRGAQNSISTANMSAFSSVVSSTIYFNGSTDYVELWGYINGTGTLTFSAGQDQTYFNGCFLRGA